MRISYLFKDLKSTDGNNMSYIQIHKPGDWEGIQLGIVNTSAKYVGLEM